MSTQSVCYIPGITHLYQWASCVVMTCWPCSSCRLAVRGGWYRICNMSMHPHLGSRNHAKFIESARVCKIIRRLLMLAKCRRWCGLEFWIHRNAPGALTPLPAANVPMAYAPVSNLWSQNPEYVTYSVTVQDFWQCGTWDLEQWCRSKLYPEITVYKNVRDNALSMSVDEARFDIGQFS